MPSMMPAVVAAVMTVTVMTVAVMTVAAMTVAAMMRTAAVAIPVPDEMQQSRLVSGLCAGGRCCGKRERRAAPRKNDGGCQQGLFHLISSISWPHGHNANSRMTRKVPEVRGCVAAHRGRERKMGLAVTAARRCPFGARYSRRGCSFR